MAADQHHDPHGDLGPDGPPPQQPAFDEPSYGGPEYHDAAPGSEAPAADPAESQVGADPAAGDAVGPDAAADSDADAAQAEHDVAAEREERLTRLFTASVTGPGGERIGKVGQVYLDDQTQEPNWITARTGLFGTKEFFVPLDEAQLDGKHIVVPYSKAQVTSAPPTEIDQNLSPDEEDALYNHYRVPGRMTDAADAPLQSGDDVEPAGGDGPGSVEDLAAALGDDASAMGDTDAPAADSAADGSAADGSAMGGGAPQWGPSDDATTHGDAESGSGWSPNDDDRRADERWADEQRTGFEQPTEQAQRPVDDGPSWAERQMGAWSINDGPVDDPSAAPPFAPPAAPLADRERASHAPSTDAHPATEQAPIEQTPIEPPPIEPAPGNPAPTYENQAPANQVPDGQNQPGNEPERESEFGIESLFRERNEGGTQGDEPPNDEFAAFRRPPQ